MHKCHNVMITGKVQDMDEIKIRAPQKGAVIDNISIEEIPFHIYLPQKFLRLYTDDLSDIGRKLDTGNEYLKEILIDSSSLPDIKNGIETINSNFDIFIFEQREHNQWIKEHSIKMEGHNEHLDKHNQHLEKILEKLVEK